MGIAGVHIARFWIVALEVCDFSSAHKWMAQIHNDRVLPLVYNK
jgi:hypothetical protein